MITLNKINGFTLLEVLIALSISSIALIAVLMSLTEYSRNASHLEHKTIAHWVGMNVIGEVQLRLITPPEAPAADTGTTTMLGKEWDWAVNLRQSDNEYTKMINVDVMSHYDRQIITHLEGFLRRIPEE